MIVLTTVNLSETTFTFQMALLGSAGLEVVERPTVRWSAAWGLVFVSGLWVKGTHALFGPLFLLAILAWRRWSWATITKVAIPMQCVRRGRPDPARRTHLPDDRRLSYELARRGPQLHRGQMSEQAQRRFDGVGVAVAGLRPARDDVGKGWDVPFTESSYFMREGLKCIQRDPGLLLVSLENVPFLFTGNFLWPASEFSIRPYVRLYELFFGPWLMAGLGMWAAARRPWRPKNHGEAIAWALPVIGLALSSMSSRARSTLACRSTCG